MVETDKYAGVTDIGSCVPDGLCTKDGKNFKSSWTGEWVLPLYFKNNTL